MSEAESRFDRIDETLERVLGLLDDHGRQVQGVKADVGGITADIRDVRRELSALRKDFQKHLLWHLGRAS